MLECYFDDSGTHGPSQMVVWGGLVGLSREWEKVERKWRSLLETPLPGKPKLKQFHLSHCAALDGEFASYKRAESDHLRWLFRQIIAESGLHACAFGVARQDWVELVTGNARRLFGADPEAFVLGSCLDAAFNAAKNLDEEFISVTFDKGRWTAPLEDWIKRGVDCYRGPVIPIDIAFRPVAEVPALQAADTIATEVYWQALASMADESPAGSAHFRSLTARTPGSFRIMRRREIQQLVARING